MKPKELKELRASIPPEVWKVWNDESRRQEVKDGPWGAVMDKVLEAENGKKVRGNCSDCGVIVWLNIKSNAIYRNPETGAPQIDCDIVCGDCYDPEEYWM